MTVCDRDLPLLSRVSGFSSDYLPLGECDLSLKSLGPLGCEQTEERLARTLHPLPLHCLLYSKHPEVGLGRLWEDSSCSWEAQQRLPHPPPLLRQLERKVEDKS